MEAAVLTYERFADEVRRCGVDIEPRLLAAVSKGESAFRPFAIGVNRDAQVPQPRSREEAVRTASRLLAEGKNFDAGVLQINSANWEWLKLDPVSVFDICRNIRAAATVLTGLSKYNTGHERRGFANGYVQNVVTNYRTLPPIQPAAPTPAEPVREAIECPGAPPAWDAWSTSRHAFACARAAALTPKGTPTQ